MSATDFIEQHADPDDLDDLEHIVSAYPVVNESDGFDGEYLEEYTDIQRSINFAVRKMRPNIIKAITAYAMNGETLGAAAKIGRTTLRTLRRYLDSDEGNYLYISLCRLKFLRDGPERSQRMHMAWRIARANEIKAPRIALQALDYKNIFLIVRTHTRFI